MIAVYRWTGRLRQCVKCGAMIALQLQETLEPCAICGGRYWRTPSLAPWHLSAQDRRFLRSLRIAAS